MALTSRLPARLRAFRSDARGASALEFALIAPFLILTYFGMSELAQGMMAQRRVSHAASAVGDLVGQSDKITDDQKKDIFAAATNIVSPFPTSPLMLRVTSITGNASGQPRVDWSDDQGIGLLKHCDAPPAPFPTGLITAAGENVIMAEATYKYTSSVSQVLPKGLTFNERFFLRPRKVAKVTRTGAETTACP